MNKTGSLQEFLDSPEINRDPALCELLKEADQWEDCALNIPDFCRHTILHASKSIETFLGIPAWQLMDEGIPGIVSRTVPADLPQLLSQQTVYMQAMKHPSYNLESALIQHYKWTTIWPSGKPIAVQSTGVICTFTEEKEWIVGIGFFLKDEPGSSRTLQKCQEFLIKLKDRHNLVYQHKNGHVLDLPYIIQYTHKERLLITKREREVLKFLASGCSTKKIAEQLAISLHTVESHRKNLLEKFKAKNSAELIKKASKIFWLE
jgi:DNA-binding CsgD family transcriptional regulator